MLHFGLDGLDGVLPDFSQPTFPLCGAWPSSVYEHPWRLCAFTAKAVIATSPGSFTNTEVVTHSHSHVFDPRVTTIPSSQLCPYNYSLIMCASCVQLTFTFDSRLLEKKQGRFCKRSKIHHKRAAQPLTQKVKKILDAREKGGWRQRSIRFKALPDVVLMSKTFFQVIFFSKTIFSFCSAAPAWKIEKNSLF